MGLIKKKKTKSIRKFLASILIGTILLTTSAPVTVQAGVWGESIAGTFLGEILDKIWQVIQGILFGIAKKVAVGMARDAANRLTAGGMDKKPAFITDYRQYIFGAAIDEGLLFMDDLLTQSTGGKGSTLNYVAAGGSVQALGKQYLSLLNSEVKSSFANDNCKYNLDQYTPNPLSSIAKGDFRVLNAVVTYPCNNPLGMTNIAKQNVQRQVSARQKESEIKAIAGKGFTGVEVNGKIVSPGSIIEGITTDAQTMAGKLITYSQGWSELLAAAAGAFVNQALSNMYQKGFEDVSKKINRELGKVDSKLNKARADISKELGPGAVFLRNAEQHIGGRGNAGTGKYTGVQQSLVNFNSSPSMCGTSATAGGC